MNTRIITTILTLLTVIIATSTSLSAQIINYVAYDSLLQKNVVDGKVYYNGFRNMMFEEFIFNLYSIHPDEMSKNDQLAFWLNAYNAFVIHSVKNYGELKSPKQKVGFFDFDKFEVAGMTLTLNKIEKDMIIPLFNTYLVHFGLVCAANDCPKLMSKAYCGATVREQLEQNGRDFIRSANGARLDRATKTLRLSQIFNWYKRDFEMGGKKLIDIIAKYSKPEDAEFIKANKADITIEFLEYDWKVNALNTLPAPVVVKPYCK
ncbi:MAG: DUF547 domain-containing protein [Ignavibacteria bacterium]|nr:DUF547 domain-containing protein [Ignavibacteria bacterium]